MQRATSVSIVVPCFNEEDVLPTTVDMLKELLEKLIEKGKIKDGSKIYFIDDGSKDNTWNLIENYALKSVYVKGIKLSHNRGHQNALLAGLLTAEGDAIISMDADLQDDPNVVEKMVDFYIDGYDLVFGVRKNRENDSFFKKYSAETYYKILKWMGVESVFNHADYRLMSRRAIEALREYGERNIYLRGIIPSMGFPSATVYYKRSHRYAGETKYPVDKMLALAIDGITSFTAYPLRLIAILGLSIFVISFFLSIWAVWIRVFSESAVPGWASSVLPMYMLGGIQLLSLGIIGEYVGKIYIESKKRPRYFIEKIV